MQEIADVYARSLFEVGEEHDKLDELHEELGAFVDELSDNRDMQVFFFSPYFSSQEKKDGISQVLEDADEHFVRFLELLAERHRLPVLFRIRQRFEELWAEHQNLLPVQITSAVELDDRIAKQIGETIEEQTGQHVELSSSVDPDVLGGLVIRVGNMVLDSSVRARLERLRKEVARAA
jgi:F-type H+-transporting ATPase subunit delta